MSAEKFKVVARLGMSYDVPILINGEFGYDIDVKTLRVGDDTAEPLKIPTSKSTGTVEYSTNLVVKYGTVDIHDGYKVDGVDLSTMNQDYGFATRVADGEFVNRELEGENNYVEIENPRGVNGNPRIKLSDSVKTLLGGDGVVAIRFTHGFEFPEDPRLGHIHYDEDFQCLYIRAAQDDGTEFWLGINSYFGPGTRYRKYYVQSTAPENAYVGDNWQDPEDDRLYIYQTENDNSFWMEQRI